LFSNKLLFAEQRGINFVFRLTKGLPTAMGIAVAVALTVAASARADTEIILQEGNGTPVTISDVTLGQNYTGTVGEYTYNVTVTASQTTGSATIEQVDADFKSFSWSSQTLYVTVQDSAFTNTVPGTLANVTNTLTTTQIPTWWNIPLGSVAADSFVNSTSDSTASVSLSADGSSNNSANLPLGSASNFTLGNTATVSAFYGELNFSVNTVASFAPPSGDPPSAAPAPASLIMAFAAVPFLGLGAWMRRRKQAKADLAS
jgi:hypothetical protein